jgi:hypothetical protein
MGAHSSSRRLPAMPIFELDDAEHAGLLRLIEETIAADRSRLSPAPSISR